MFITHLLEELLACRRWGILELNPCCCPSCPWYKIQRKCTLRQVESCSEVWMSPQRGRAVFAVLAPIAPFQKQRNVQVKDGHPGTDVRGHCQVFWLLLNSSDLRSASVGDLQMLLGSVGAGGNSVLARFSVGCPTFFAALCWWRLDAGADGHVLLYLGISHKHKYCQQKNQRFLLSFPVTQWLIHFKERERSPGLSGCTCDLNTDLSHPGRAC